MPLDFSFIKLQQLTYPGFSYIESELGPNQDPIECRFISAIKTLKEKGWCQGVLKNGKGEVCAVGSLLEGLDIMEWRSRSPELIGRLLRAIRDNYNVAWQAIPDWNDAKGRTKEEVIAMLESALDTYLKEKENGTGQ